MRILFSNETSDKWIFQAYTSFFDAISAQGNEAYMTACNLDVSIDIQRKYNIIDYRYITNPQVLEIVRKNLNSVNEKIFEKAASAKCWSSTEQIIQKLSFFKTILGLIQPDVVVGWNGMTDIRLMAKDLVTDLGIPYLYAEKGMLPESWYIDSAGINAACSLDNSCVQQIQDVSLKEQTANYIESIVKTGASAWNQPDRLGPQELRKSLNLPENCSVVFFPGQVDEDTNITAFSPFTSMAQAVQTILRSLPQNTVLLIKPHPKSSAESQTALAAIANNQKAMLVNRVNVWDIIEIADIVISINSTVAFEAILQKKSVILLGDSILTKVGLLPKTLPNQLTEKIAACLAHRNDDKDSSARNIQFTAFLRNQYYMFKDRPVLSPVAQDCLIEKSTSSEAYLLSSDKIFTMLHCSELAKPIAINKSLSVIITTCNRPDMLRQVLEGFVSQTAQQSEFEVIVVDDGSQPPVKELIESFSPKLDISYIYQENNGLAAARNTGIKAAGGEIVLFHDDDDLPHPDLISEHIKSHLEYPEENVAVLGHLEWHSSLKVTPLMHYVSGPGGQYFGFSSMEHGKFYDQIKWWGGLISAKLSLLKKLEGPFDPKFRFGYEDIELSQRLSDRNIKILYNAHAIKYILRPINFEEFCRRCVRQGRALYHLAQKHPAFTLKRYHLETAIDEYREHYQNNLNKWQQRLTESEPRIQFEKVSIADKKDIVTDALHKIWAKWFRGYVVHGYLEEKSAAENGTTMMGLPVNLQNKIAIPDSTQKVNAQTQRPLRIMFVSNRLPRPDVGSSNVRVHNIVKLLAEAGHCIEYVHFARDNYDDDYIRQWQNKIAITSLDANATALINHVYFDAPQPPDILWVTNLWAPSLFERMREVVYWFRRLFPQTRIVIDTMDYHSKKYLRKYEYSKDKQDKILADQFAVLEEQLYPFGDRVITVTREESRAIASAIKGCSCSIIPNIHQPLLNLPSFDARANIVFIGSMQVNHNLDAVCWFVKEVFPLIRQQLPAIEFHIMGFDCGSYKADFEEHSGVKVIGYVQDAEQAISNYRLFVCPMRYGAGMKGKLGTAAAAGTPFVTTNIGAEGFDFTDGKECFVTDDAEEFARNCLTLINEKPLWENFAQRTRDKFINFSPKAIAPQLNDLLNSLMDTSPRIFNIKSAADETVKVAVITAVHNGQEFLAEMIESVLNQTMKEFELWLLDDRSTDNTPKIIEEFAKRDSRIKPVFFDDNKGPYVRRNYAIERTAAPFIVIHDADDIMTPTKLEVLCNHIEADENIGIVGHWYYNFIDEFRSLANTSVTTFPLEVRQIKENLLRQEASLTHGAAIIRKKLFGIIGLYDENPFSSDSVWLQKAALYWNHTGNMFIKNIPDCLLLRRIHVASQVASLPATDPRGRRYIFNSYAAQKIDTLANQLKTFNGSDEALSRLFKQCSCANFLQDCDHLIKEAAAKPLDEEVLLCLVYQIMELFNAQNYIGLIKQSYHIEAICAEVPQRFRNYEFFKAMAFYALGHAERAWQSLEREIQNHNNNGARCFMNDFKHGACTDSILDWFHKYYFLYELEITEVQAKAIDETLVATGPLVSVIMAVDEKTKHISASISSVLKQSYSRFELLIVDYGSVKNNVSAISSAADTRCRYIHKESGNLSSARNEAIRQARGEYIVFLGADDAIAPHYIYKHIEAFLQHPEASLIYCDYRFIDEQGRHVRLFQHQEYTDNRHLIRDMFRCGYSIIQPRGLIRRNIFDLIGLFDESLLIDQEYDVMRRFISRGCKAVRLSKALYLQRCQPKSLPKANMLAEATSHFTAVRRWAETFKGEELFPDVVWDNIARNRRGVYLQTLIGATYRTIGRNYVQSQTAINASIAFDLACSALKESLKSEPNNMQAKILLDQCENEKRQLQIAEAPALTETQRKY